jgi:hypothetical protein
MDVSLSHSSLLSVPVRNTLHATRLSYFSHRWPGHDYQQIIIIIIIITTTTTTTMMTTIQQIQAKAQKIIIIQFNSIFIYVLSSTARGQSQRQHGIQKTNNNTTNRRKHIKKTRQEK